MKVTVVKWTSGDSKVDCVSGAMTVCGCGGKGNDKIK